uniref:ABC-type glutathione-S-conjugate transporter n=1 Tax=Amphimedon queenslandica TaxID=400682 RepID=A0A1X7UX79_AMPQE
MVDQLCKPGFFWEIESFGQNGTLTATIITLCFEDTVILYGVCLFFWILASVNFLCRKNREFIHIPFNLLLVTKLVLCFVITLVTLSDFIYAIIVVKKNTIASYFFISPFVMAFTMVIVILLLISDYKKGVRSSGPPVILWVGLVAYASIKLWSILTKLPVKENVKLFFLITFALEYFCFLLQLLLSFIPEPKSIDDINENPVYRPSPEKYASFFSLVTWWWLKLLIWKGSHKVLTHDDLYDINHEDKSEVTSLRFQKEWGKEVKRSGLLSVQGQKNNQTSKTREPSLFLALFRAYALDIITGGFYKMCYDALFYVNPLLLRMMLAYINDKDQPPWIGYIFTVVMFLVALLHTIINQQYQNITIVTGMRIRSGLIATIYNKSLVLTRKAYQSRTIGEMINLMSIDANRLMELWHFFYLMCFSPLRIIVVLVGLYWIIIATLFACLLINYNSDYNITAVKIFVAISLFDILRLPLYHLPMALGYMVQANISQKRICSFLTEEELNSEFNNKEDYDESHDNAVSITGGLFSWGDERDEFLLSNIELSIKPGELVAVVGPVGSGKSALISAIIGEMNKLKGSVVLRGRVAYVPQIAWILNDTVKNNITFGKRFNSNFYNEVLKACTLEADLEILPGGDMTEIGEKGINLSGGQKQRVSLARAVYQESDVYLLDDPLSAVDSHVGKHIFDNVIGPEGLLKNKVRFLVTHDVRFLSQCNKIVVMNNGSIDEVGNYSELLECNELFSEILKKYRPTDRSDEEKQDIESLAKQSTSVSNKNTKETIIYCDEEIQIGIVKMSVIFTYINSYTFTMFFVVMVLSSLSTGGYVGQLLWLAHWSNEKSTNNLTHFANLGIYATIGIVQSMCTSFTFLAIASGAIKASRKFHNGMLHSIIRSPMSFFDTTPLGRLVNRFSKDIQVTDEKINIALQKILLSLFSTTGTIISISVVSPWFLIVVVPITIVYLIVQRFYISTSRQLKRLEATSRSPIYSHFKESIDGISSIRAYNVAERFRIQFEFYVDSNQAVLYFSENAIIRWLSIQVDFIGAIILFFAALFVTLQRNYPHIFGLIDPGLAGMSLSQAFMVTLYLSMTVRTLSDLESSLVSVERIKEYLDLPSEAPEIIHDNRPDPNWPEDGSIQFNKYATRYRPGLDLVLKNISCYIPGGQKVGIVGRTGAGKSSLTISLFRIIEADKGSISIDGIDISMIGLSDLRSQLTIIPQDPLLFSGTLRFNLDPFNTCTDDEIWRALHNAHLSAHVQGLSKGLDHIVTEGGENLSVGECQLMCLARALLRKTKILIAEFDTPKKLLELQGLFYRLVTDAGLRHD